MSDETKVTPSTSAFNLTPSVAILLSGVFIAGAIIFVNYNPPSPAVLGNSNDPQNLPTNANVPPVSETDHIRGPRTAPIVLVEYSDFQCPYCRIVHATLKRLVDESNGEVAWVLRNFPLESIHPEARPSALAAECIAEQLGDDGFWKFADAIFADQSKMSSAYYVQLAKQFGANEATFNACVASEKHAARIDKEALDAQQNGGTGTPFTVIIGGDIQVPISGALPYEQFASVIKAIKERQ
ncbi:MAG TPA: thioredoxin domain-containing protein [Candidatus Paceibacterota bacterium]|nr:thioredoxin domain-containing protein [Candidatus Paceibacterota bacterium]